jgi:Xaa-Pro aminopeptidase
VKVLGQALHEIGLVSRPEQKQVELYFMHGLGHPLGLAVHDVFDRTRPFEPGMVVTNEPGLYVRKDDVLASKVFKDLPADEQAGISEALARYEDMGVRIEDNVQITDGEPRVLSQELPRTVEEIEAFLA